MSGDAAGSSSMWVSWGLVVSLVPEPYSQPGDGVWVVVTGTPGWKGGRAASVALKSPDLSRTKGLAAGAFVFDA